MRRDSIGRIFVRSGLFLLAAAAVAAQHQTAENADEPRALSAGDAVERAIAPQQRHRYRVRLAAGQFVRFEIAEQSCYLVMSLKSPDDVNLLEFAPVEPANGVKTVAAAVAETGVYELRVYSYGKLEGSGSYTVKIGEIRPADARELDFTAGVKLFNEAFNAADPALSTAAATAAALAKGRLALEKFRRAGAVKNEAFTMRQLATLAGRLGVTDETIGLYRAALEKYRAAGDRRGAANTLKDLGHAHLALAEAEKAISALAEALVEARELKLEMTEAEALNSLGEAYALFGDEARAAAYYRQSADIYLAYANISRSKPLNNLGKIAANAGEPEKAREYFRQALDGVRAEKNRFGTTRASEIAYLLNLGRAEYALGRREDALAAFAEARDLSRELGDRSGEAAALKCLGQAHLDAGEPAAALVELRAAAGIFRAVEARRPLAETLLTIARAEARRNELAAAESVAAEALGLIEQIRAGVRGADLRDSFAADLRNFYGFYVELLMRRHRAEPARDFAVRAFEAAERGRARAFLNLLAEAKIDLRQDADAALVAREASQQNRLAAQMENLTRALSGRATAGEIEKRRAEIEELRAEYEQTRARLRATSPRYAALTQPAALSLAELRRDVLDEQTVLLEYFLGERESYLFIVSANDFRVVELPARTALESAARGFHQALTARNRQIKFETAFERDDRLFLADAAVGRLARELGAQLFAPAAPHARGKRLLIVADGALQYVPFAALEVDEQWSVVGGQWSEEERSQKLEVGSPESAVLGRKPKTENRKPKTENCFLIESHELTYLPSASALAVLRRETAARPAAPKTLAVLADPIFDAGDERFRAAGPKAKDAARPGYLAVSRAATADGEGALARLPYTRREAELIAALVRPGELAKRLDFAASRDAALSGELARYRFVHFATHGVIDERNPALSGIVLSLYDENGAPQNGFLRADDVYNLKLSAELVVLSACRTGLGKEIRGEGLVGLTRGLFYAGARRTAVSLWSVNDEATSELMARFYRSMLGDRRLAPAAALREAQIAMLRENRWRNPYYWASFVLQGEAR